MHLHFVKYIWTWISFESILCLMSYVIMYNVIITAESSVDHMKLRCFQNIIYLHFCVCVCVSFPHFISTFLFHHYIPLLYITFGSCDEMLWPCSLFTLGGKATLGWLHFRNVAPKSLPSCFLPTTFIRLSSPCTDSLFPFILSFLLLSHPFLSLF